MNRRPNSEKAHDRQKCQIHVAGLFFICEAQGSDLPYLHRQPEHYSVRERLAFSNFHSNAARLALSLHPTPEVSVHTFSYPPVTWPIATTT